MGTALGSTAFFRRAGVKEFHTDFNDPRISQFRKKVSMVLDPEIGQLYPQRWTAKITVETADGRTLHSWIDEPKGDPGNGLTRSELKQKATELAEHSGAATAAEMQAVFAVIGEIASAKEVGHVLASHSPADSFVRS
jgi:2-methylcitrate dehydratase PrpD